MNTLRNPGTAYHSATNITLVFFNRPILLHIMVGPQKRIFGNWLIQQKKSVLDYYQPQHVIPLHKLI